MKSDGVGWDDIINSTITLFLSSLLIPLVFLRVVRAIRPPNRLNCRHPSSRTPSSALPCYSSSTAPLFPA